MYEGLRYTGQGAEFNKALDILAAYLDDLAVGSETHAKQLADLQHVLDRTRKAGLRMKLAKCKFGVRSVEMLGHNVTSCEMRPSDDHTDVFRQYKEPSCAPKLLRFIGLASIF